jgi:hypothetical protein
LAGVVSVLMAISNDCNNDDLDDTINLMKQRT